jgi:hypothetical protein
MKQELLKNKMYLIILCLFLSASVYGQKPLRVGTTAANFLEIGYGASGSAMGDAQVSFANDVSSIYWNPAGLARLERSEIMFAAQPWIAGMNSSFAALGIVVEGIGTVGAGIIMMDYGDINVTTMDRQEGTDEVYNPRDMALYISFARNLVEWFSFGVSGKLINSSIWHMNATAFAVDLGVLIRTGFFSPTGDKSSGLNIGMSISNYGTPLRYDGLDLLNPIDILPGEAGNYRDASGQFRLQEWELPLIFRIGTSVTPVKNEMHEFVIAADALHPNNNSESVNVGAQYTLSFITLGKVFLRGGYKALFMEQSQYGASFGIGVQTDMLFNSGLKVEYAYCDIGVLGSVNSFGLSVKF